MLEILENGNLSEGYHRKRLHWKTNGRKRLIGPLHTCWHFPPLLIYEEPFGEVNFQSRLKSVLHKSLEFMLSAICQGKDFKVLARKSRSKLLRQLCLQRTTHISYASLLDEQVSLGLRYR